MSPPGPEAVVHPSVSQRRLLLSALAVVLAATALAHAGLYSDALASGCSDKESNFPKDEVPVLGGQLVTTMKVMVPIPLEFLKDPIGKTAHYGCGILGFSKSLQRWDFFSETSTVPAFLLKGAPSEIRGTFTW